MGYRIWLIGVIPAGRETDLPKIFNSCTVAKIMDNSTKNASIELEIADLNRQLKPNINAPAKSYSLVESTLRRRFKGESLSFQAAHLVSYQRLSIV